MGDQYLSLRHDPGNLLGQVGVHSVRPSARPDMANLCGPYFPDSLWWQYLAYVYGHEMPFVISDGTNPRASWSQGVEGPTTRSPILPRGRIPEKPSPLDCAPDNGDGNFDNQAGAVPNRRTHAEYNQYITMQEEQEAKFNFVSPVAQTQPQATCVLVKYHSNIGKNFRKLDKIQIREAHGTL